MLLPCLTMGPQNEETAIAAGYRPCAICMPDRYKVWKKTKKLNNV